MMQILAVDIGTGTQDVLLFDTEREPENALKLVMPSPTVLLAQAIRRATQSQEALLLTGVTMGGGPCAWAIEDHLRAGLAVFSTPDAARTINDDLGEVGAMGVEVIGEDAVARLGDVRRLTMVDFDYDALARAFGAFDVDLDRVDLLAIAVFDHGAAPRGVSDRLFRFEYLAQRIQAEGGLAAFAFPRDQIPSSMTRLQSAASTAPADRPVVAMDTAPAAVLGALEDRHVQAHEEAVIVNIGNFHTLAFHLRCRTSGPVAGTEFGDRMDVRPAGGVATLKAGTAHILGLFEHHTGLLSQIRLEELLVQLANGTLSHDQLFADHGHGALMLDQSPSGLGFVALTGPRRGLLAGSFLQPYLAVPYGDMMMAGCWGLVRACAQTFPWTAQAIERALDRS